MSKTKSYPEIDYIFSNTKTDAWNKDIISRKMQSLGAAVKGESAKLNVETANKLSQTNKKSPRPPKGKKKRRRNKNNE